MLTLSLLPLAKPLTQIVRDLAVTTPLPKASLSALRSATTVPPRGGAPLSVATATLTDLQNLKRALEQSLSQLQAQVDQLRTQVQDLASAALAMKLGVANNDRFLAFLLTEWRRILLARLRVQVPDIVAISNGLESVILASNTGPFGSEITVPPGALANNAEITISPAATPIN